MKENRKAEKYEAPTLEIIHIDHDDIIATSGFMESLYSCWELPPLMETEDDKNP